MADGAAARGLAAAIAVAATALGATTSLAIVVSTWRPPPGLEVWGAPTVWRGHTAAIRASERMPTGLADGPARQLCLQICAAAAPTRAVPVADATAGHASGSPGAAGARGAAGPACTMAPDCRLDARPAQWEMAVPADAGAQVTLAVWPAAEGATAAVRRVLDVVDVPRLTGALASPAATAAAEDGRQLELCPAHGALVGGLANAVAVRVRCGTATCAGRVRCPQLGLDVQATAAGAPSVMLLPPPVALDLACTVDGAPLRAPLHVAVQPLQQTLALVPPAAVLRPGAPLSARLQTLPSAAPVFVDLWAGDCLVAARRLTPTRGGLTVTLPTPADHRGLLRLTAYRELARPFSTAVSAAAWSGDAAAAARAVRALPGATALAWPPAPGDAPLVTKGRAPSAALPATPSHAPSGALDAAPREAPMDPLSAWQVALTLLRPAHVAPPLLGSSGAERAAHFAAARAMAMQRLRRFAAAQVALLLGSCGVYARGIRRRRAAALRAALPTADAQSTRAIAALGAGDWLALAACGAAVALGGGGLAAWLAALRWE